VVAAWHAAVANEWRIRVATYRRGAWSPVATLARSLDLLDRIAILGRDATVVRWLERDPRGGPIARDEASRRGSRWIVSRSAEVLGPIDRPTDGPPRAGIVWQRPRRIATRLRRR
jgi:hypothetical protein